MEGENKIEQKKKSIKRDEYKSHHTKSKYYSRTHHNNDTNKEKSHFNHNKNKAQHQSQMHSVRLDIKSASVTAKDKLAEALNKKANTVVSVSKEGENWDVVIEIIDEEYLPGKNLASMSDIIGVYEVKLSSQGELLSWTKKSSRKRGNTSV